MVDARVSARMARTTGRDNEWERSVRSCLHRRGLRFRLHYKVSGLPRRTVDIAMPGKRIAIFLDGCFWHSCPIHGTHPKSNGTWWREKLRANQVRDDDTNRRLDKLGWRVLRFWGHQPISEIVDLIEEAARRLR
ncbi:very short patch repair endonuclease [Arenimonas composti]|uniref:very short patch repair endonuclease n=1 Tax=Arenimonas composti TaxID=370776 RepID=UPI003CCCD88F